MYVCLNVTNCTIYRLLWLRQIDKQMEKLSIHVYQFFINFFCLQ